MEKELFGDRIRFPKLLGIIHVSQVQQLRRPSGCEYRNTLTIFHGIGGETGSWAMYLVNPFVPRYNRSHKGSDSAMIEIRLSKNCLIPMARIQFSRGIDEEAVPDVRLTRSRDGSNGTATFYFENPKALSQTSTEDITGMYLIDEEGELATREVKAKFINGQPAALEAVYLIKSAEQWERFMRFMNRYAEENGLGFNKS